MSELKPNITVPLKISIFYGHAASNIGDLAINTGQMALLRESFPGAVINLVFFSASSQYLNDALVSFGREVDYIFNFTPSPLKALKYLSDPADFLKHCGAQDADLIVMASGEHLFSYIENENIDSLFWRTLPVLAAKAADKQSVLLPSTLGPFEVNEASDLMTTVLGLVDNFAIRDTFSKQYAEELLKTNNPNILLDPAFFINPSTDNLVLSGDDFIAPDEHLAIVMRSEGWGIRLSSVARTTATNSFKQDNYKTSAAFQFARHLCDDYLKQTGGTIVLYVQTIADKQLTEFLFSDLIQTWGEESIKIYRPKSVNDYLRCLLAASCTVASRFHAIILSLVIGKPSYGVFFDAHGHKMPGLFDLIGASEKCFGLNNNISPKNLSEKVLIEVLGPQEWLGSILGHIDQLRKETISWLKSITQKDYEAKELIHALSVYNSFAVEYFINCLKEESVNKHDKLQLQKLHMDLLKERKDLQEKHTVLQEEHKKTRKRLYRTTLRLTDHRTQINLLKLHEKKMRSSIAFRIGQTIVKDAKRPLHWLLFPIKLLRLYLVHRKNLSRTSQDAYIVKTPDVKKAKTPDVKKAKTQIDLIKHLSVDSVSPISSVDNRICYVLHNSLPYASGGYATRAHGLSRGFIQSGFEVFALTRPGFPHDVMDIDFSDVIDEKIDGVHYGRIHFPQRKGVPTADYMDSIIDEFEKKFRKIRPSVVLAASFYITAFPALIAARRLGIPCIYELRGLAEITRMSRDKNYKGSADYNTRVRMEAETAIAADHVFTLTEPMRQELVVRGVEAEKITLLPNSCDETRFSPLERNMLLADSLGIPIDVPVIGYIGTIVDYEGLDDLVNACGLLKQRGIVFRLIIVGSEDATGAIVGKISTHLKKSAATSGLNEWLIMPGRIPHEQVEDYYSLIDIAPFPRKPWPVCEMVSPMKPLEALAMKKAVIVSSVSALQAMISDEETGLVFEKGNVNALTDALQRLAEDEELRLRLGERGRTFVETERNWTKTAEKGAVVIRDTIFKEGAAPEGIVPESGLVDAAPDGSHEGADTEGTNPVSTPVDAASNDGPEGATPSRKKQYDVERDFKAPLLSVQRNNKSSKIRFPAWWHLVPKSFAEQCSYVFLHDRRISEEATSLRNTYIERFGQEAVERRIPMSNWKRADICWQSVPNDLSTIDIGSGLGEFVNLFAINNPNTSITSVDTRDWDKWFDATGRVERIYNSIFQLDSSDSRDVVTCFEVIEHLPPERVAEAVDILRNLAKKKLFVSVPFMEPLPLYKGHFTRFTEENLITLFPDAKFTVFGKSKKRSDKVHAWILCEISIR